MSELVSILIPAYNAEKWIHHAIHSAVGQTWRRKEIIVVDDGSTDSTLSVARSNASSRVLVLSQENRGASAARNLALSRAQGDYIQYLDADDLLAADKISWQMEKAEPGSSSLTLLSASWGKFYCHASLARFNTTPLWEDLSPSEWLFRKAAHNSWMPPICWLVSRRLTDAAGPWNESLTLDDDGEYFCRVINACTHIRFVPCARCFYRTGNPGSLSKLTQDHKKLRSQFMSLRFQLQSLISKEDSPRTRAAGLELLERWADYFHEPAPDIYEDLKSLAADLGGQITDPAPDIKMQISSKLLGSRNARRIQWLSRKFRADLAKGAEALHYHLAGIRPRNATPGPDHAQYPRHVGRGH